MDLSIDLAARGDRAARIYAALRAAILDGRVPEGERLPPTRQLAAELGVSRTTVTVAYELLAAEGFVAGRVGAGTVVICDRPAGVGSASAAPRGGVRPRAGWSVPGPGLAVLEARGAVVDGDAPAPRFDFSVGSPDAALFPVAAWRREVLRAVDIAASSPPGYADPAGHPALRAAVARHIAVSRGVRATSDTVLITAGAQGALSLLGAVMVEPGMTVAVEEPGYPPARDLFAALGARVVPVPVDVDGLVVDALPADARLVVVTPSHQFPTGVRLSLARRGALLAWADRHDALIVEDDYDSEHRFSARPLEPLQALDRSGRVAYVGSFSKTMAPFLRLGYLVAPPGLVAALTAARRLADWHGELTTQLAMAGFIESGRLAWQLRRVRKVYAARHEQLVAAVSDGLGAWFDVLPASAGLHVCAALRAGVALDLGKVAARAAERGIRVERLVRYRALPGPDGLVLGYGRIVEDRIADGVSGLAAVIREVADGRDGG